ncbi:MAG: hypothetical protein GX238_09885 [Epulopiscium sp.]|nr:hypothetical protein [Candidatus Epulonipiscium sp.]
MFRKMVQRRFVDMKQFPNVLKKMTKQEEKKCNWPWIVLGVVALLTGIGLALWFYMRPDDEWDEDWDEEDWDDEDWDFEDDDNIIAIDGSAYNASKLKEDLEQSMQTELEDGEDPAEEKEEE